MASLRPSATYLGACASVPVPEGNPPRPQKESGFCRSALQGLGGLRAPHRHQGQAVRWAMGSKRSSRMEDKWMMATTYWVFTRSSALARRVDLPLKERLWESDSPLVTGPGNSRGEIGIQASGSNAASELRPSSVRVSLFTGLKRSVKCVLDFLDARWKADTLSLRRIEGWEVTWDRHWDFYVGLKKKKIEIRLT